MAGGELHGVAKRYGRRRPWVLHSVDLALEPGTSTLVLGANGSGKSTLLRLAAGLSEPTLGAVDLPERISYVPERLAARCRFSAREYLAHMGRIRGMGPRALRERSDELVTRLGLFPGPDVGVDTLSKGNRQKVVVAQAFLTTVDLIVLDEPASGLDVVASSALGELMAEATSHGAATCCAAHPSGVTALPDQIYDLDDGRLRERRAVDRGAARRPVVRIEIRCAQGAAPLAELAGVGGVLRTATTGPGTAALEVAREDVDRMLLRALRSGWSVDSVRSVETEGNGPCP
ncbi:MAG TPA: ABC transporter ATP-binding protein [Acidimicrobiales bacterium]|nr:ABC transporter ATP-binding protein [Acidimicrobiales bacterium]